uniref:Tripartite motif-containing protein 2 n=1 Tax=Schistocephalus solidus TaxID=70667 RepID=A0A0V0J3Z1_SCHSO
MTFRRSLWTARAGFTLLTQRPVQSVTLNRLDATWDSSGPAGRLTTSSVGPWESQSTPPIVFTSLTLRSTASRSSRMVESSSTSLEAMGRNPVVSIYLSTSASTPMTCSTLVTRVTVEFKFLTITVSFFGC